MRTIRAALATILLLGSGCDLFGGTGSGNRRSFDVVFENRGPESIHMDFANKTHVPENLVQPQQVRVEQTTATIGTFLRFEVGRDQVVHGSADCQLTTDEPSAARVIWEPPELSCQGFDGSSGPDTTSAGSGASGSSGSSSGSGSGGTSGSGGSGGGSGSGTG